jgi:hypothetical protein
VRPGGQPGRENEANMVKEKLLEAAAIRKRDQAARRAIAELRRFCQERNIPWAPESKEAVTS